MAAKLNADIRRSIMHHVVVPPIVDQMLALEVYPEKEKPPLQEVVTEEPPGALLDANSPNNLQTRYGDGSKPVNYISLYTNNWGNRHPLASYLGYLGYQGLTQSYMNILEDCRFVSLLRHFRSIKSADSLRRRYRCGRTRPRQY